MFGDGTPQYFPNGLVNAERYGFIDRTISGTYYFEPNDKRTVATTGLTLAPNSRLRIMKGSIPTSFSELVDDSSRFDDCLIDFYDWTNSNYGGGVRIKVDTLTNPIKISTIFDGARLSGTATWFWFLCWLDRSPNNTYSQFYGTVGVPGSGADLIIPNVNIVQNTQYRISELLINIPSSWTY
jgi:hypothetical protein